MADQNSNSKTNLIKNRKFSKSDLSMSIGFAVVVLFFIATSIISYWNVRVLSQDSHQVVQTHEIISAPDDLLSTMKDAETGQRGFLISGVASYMEPYSGALTHLDERLNDLERYAGGFPQLAARIPDMKVHIHTNVQELAETISLRQSKGFEESRKVVVTNRGKAQMDALRTEVELSKKEANDLRDRRLGEMDAAYRSAVVSGIFTGLLGAFLSCVVGYLVQSAAAMKRREQWLQTGQVGLSSAMFGEQRTELWSEISSNFLPNIATLMPAQFLGKIEVGFSELPLMASPTITEPQLKYGSATACLAKPSKTIELS